ncbi:MAG: M48 family metalloprotease [Alphaproteobacteria bacterium]
MTMIVFRKFIQLFLLIALFAPQAYGQSIIRDTEIEDIFREWTQPILKTADIPQKNVNIVLVQSPQINAFVAGGANIFFYTGLLQKTENPDEVIGVFAHELGHIAGSHLIAQRQALERASYESILGTVLGIGAALVGGGDASAAIIRGSQGLAASRYLAHSRVHESAADQAALRYFEGAGFNPEGLKTFLQKLQGEELLPTSRQVEYVRTHPLTHNRITAVENRAAQSPHKDAKFPAHWYEQHARMKAKLLGFIDPGRVAWDYDDRDQSIPARYARAIAAYRESRVEDAVAGINALIADEPDNPHFHELKGQMLVEFARVEEAIPAYAKAVKLRPDAALFRIAYAHALLQDSDKAHRGIAIDNLQRALRDEPRSTRAHRLLARAYGQMGNEDLAKLHLAEEALLQRRIPYARRQAESVEQSAKPKSKELLMARDMLAYIKTLKEESN